MKKVTNTTLSMKAAEGVTKLLDSVLKVEANSTSCLMIYEPKTPNGLLNFKRKK